MSNLMNIVKNPRVIKQYIGGVINERSAKTTSYQLAFVKEKSGRWYIDLPEWEGAHANLEMVAGADLLLDHLPLVDVSYLFFEGAFFFCFVVLVILIF